MESPIWNSRAANDVLHERRRQVEAEGWSPGHDDEHSNGELAQAAACYATHQGTQGLFRELPIGAPPPAWPWAQSWWKPGLYRRNLVKAAALLIAEIERLDQLEKVDRS